VDQVVLAPSLHNSQPWQFVVHAARLEIQADRRRHLPGIDQLGRGLAQNVGAALFNARVALAARGWAVEVDRRPGPTIATCWRSYGWSTGLRNLI
jgi:nitroreductase